jgi:regulator of RNase E activity RraA
LYVGIDEENITMNQITDKIINFIKRNRVSTTEVADCLGKTGAIPETIAVNRGLHCVGRVRYIFGYNESNWSIHEQARDAEENEIVFIDGIDVNDRALVGELVIKYLVLYKGVSAVVMLGKARDANDIIRNKYPVWCQGFSPVGCFNLYEEIPQKVTEIASKRKSHYHGGVAICDDTGVVLIPKERLNDDLYDSLNKIEEQEDAWFYCIDRLGWDTFDTVCLKKYMEVIVKE